MANSTLVLIGRLATVASMLVSAFFVLFQGRWKDYLNDAQKLMIFGFKSSTNQLILQVIFMGTGVMFLVAAVLILFNKWRLGGYLMLIAWIPSFVTKYNPFLGDNANHQFQMFTKVISLFGLWFLIISIDPWVSSKKEKLHQD